MRKLFLLILLFTVVAAGAQSSEKLKSPPAGTRYKGKPIEVVKWTDKLGENILILSASDPVAAYSKEMEDEAVTWELYGYHYIKNDTGYKLRWRLIDAIRECPVDVDVAFIAPATITDLDSDGIFESTVMYKLACRGDVSPSTMKLIMHEDSAKYALRGLMWLPFGEESKFDINENNADVSALKGYDPVNGDWLLTYGRYENEKEFKSVPKFITHARKQWVKFVKESFD